MKIKTKYFILAILFGVMALCTMGFASWNIHLQTDIEMQILPTDGSYATERLALFEKYIKWCGQPLPDGYNRDTTVLEALSGQDYSIEVDTTLKPTGATVSFAELKIGFEYKFYAEGSTSEIAKPSAAGEYICKIVAKTTDTSAENAIEKLNLQHDGCAAEVKFKIIALTPIPTPIVNSEFTYDESTKTYQTVYDGTQKTFFTNTADFSEHVTGLTQTSATDVDTYTITLTPKSNCVWGDGSASAITYTFRIVEPVCHNLTKNINYATVEEALNAAVSGDILYLIPGEKDNYSASNKVAPDKVEYSITKNCEIKSGVTLILPTDKTTLSTVTDSSTLNTYIENMYTSDTSETSTAYASETNYLRCTLNIADGVTLTNNGKLVVSGYLSAGNSGACMLGHTAYSYAQIKLGAGASILQNNSAAITYLFGYIFEQAKDNGSTVDVNSGTLYVPFIINDYRGFSFSWAMTDGAIDNNRCSAFNQFELRNVDALTTVKYGAKVSGYVNVLVNNETPSVNQAFTKEIKLIGTDNSYFLQLTNSNYSYVKYKFNQDKDTPAQLDVYGGATLNYISLELSASALTVNLSTNNAYFPLSYRMSVSLNKNENQTKNAVYDLTKQRIKLLPGSQLTINGNCEVTANEIIAYAAFYDGAKGDGRNSKNAYSNVSYPLKEGAMLIINDNAKLTSTKLAGTIYKGEGSTVTYTTDKITAKEPWNYKTSGKVKPAWTIDDYLEIHEELQFVPLDYKNKTKLYVALNTFTNYNSYLPSLDIDINDTVNDTVSISGYQKVIFSESITSYTVSKLNANIYQIKYGNDNIYKVGSSIDYSTVNQVICAINSTLSIQNNAETGGVNEFIAQSITINCDTPLDNNGNIPLFAPTPDGDPGTTIQLSANVVDIDKIYDKTITWKTSDANIATVDQKGQVTGVSKGTVTITATCAGKSATFELTVNEAQEIIGITGISITDNKGNSSESATGTNADGEYRSNTDVTFEVNILPEGASYNSITWQLTASAAGRQWINDNTQIVNTITGKTSIIVHIGSGTNLNPDNNIPLVCTVVDLKGNEFKATFTITHKADLCLVEGTLITLADGTKKKVEDLTVNDNLLVFNHETGKWDTAPFMLMVHAKTPANYHRVVELRFSDNSILRIAYEHGLYDKDLNKYVFISEYNARDFIGHSFVTSKYNNGEVVTSTTKLVDVTVRTECVRIFNPVSTWHVNVVANDFLTTSPYMANFFEYDQTMKYDEKLMQEDIEKYGLYTYDDFKDYIPETSFAVFPYSYFKVAIGKGISTFDNILNLLSHALNPDTLLAPTIGITEFTISLDASGGNCSTNIINVTMGDAYSTARDNEGNIVGLPTPIRMGYTFAGWYIKDTNILITNDTKVDNLTIYDYTITFIAKWNIYNSGEVPIPPEGACDNALPPTAATNSSTESSGDKDEDN